jgi:hypothetical protein
MSSTVSIHLSEGTTLVVDTDFETMQDAYKTALAGDKLIEITDEDGVTRAVNPNEIAFFEGRNGTHRVQQGPASQEHQIPA